MPPNWAKVRPQWDAVSGRFVISTQLEFVAPIFDGLFSGSLNTALTANGGEQSHCGWLKDRYGVSWQIFPKRLTELTTSTNKEVSAKAMAAMMKQMKIDISAIEAAVRE